MASTKPAASLTAPLSPEMLGLMQVSDSNEKPRVSSSCSELEVVLKTKEPVIFTPMVPRHLSVSYDPLAQLSEPAAGVSSSEPIAVCLRDVPQQYLTSAGSIGRRKNLYAEEVRSQWNLFRIFSVLGSREQCIKFAEERGLLPTSKLCTYHKKPMNVDCMSIKNQVGQFRCRKGNCRKKAVSRAKGTWFENAKLPLPQLFQLMYMFSVKYSYSTVQREINHCKEAVLSLKTIADWFHYCRETVIVYQLDHQIKQEKIGGIGKIVQLDESKFGKRKCNRGRNVEDLWILGLKEDGKDDLRLEVFPGIKGGEKILMPLIEKHVEKGTTIHTNFPGACDYLSKHGYKHKEFKYSPTNNGVAPNGVQTENHWRLMKLLFGKDNYKDNFTEWMIEKIWRRKIRLHHLDPFEELLKCVSYVYKK